jgi:hypothetical protein
LLQGEDEFSTAGAALDYRVTQNENNYTDLPEEDEEDEDDEFDDDEPVTPVDPDLGEEEERETV